MLVCVVIENVSVGVDVNHVLKFRVDDEVDCVGECLSKMKLNTKVALFYKLKVITRAVVWRQVETESCVARAIIASVYLVACIQTELSSSRKKTLKSGYNILTTSFAKLEKQGFSMYLFAIDVRTHLVTVVMLKVKRVGAICTVKSFGIHQY